MEVDASEIRIRAERRLGEMIAKQKETVGLATGGDAMKARFQPGTEVRPTLAAAGIDKKLSSRAQKLAAVPEDKFEGMLGEWQSATGRRLLCKKLAPTLPSCFSKIPKIPRSLKRW